MEKLDSQQSNIRLNYRVNITIEMHHQNHYYFAEPAQAKYRLRITTFFTVKQEFQEHRYNYSL